MLQLRKTSPRACEPYESLARSELGSKKIGEVRRRDLHDWKSTQLRAGKAGGTLNGIISKLNRLFGWLVSLEVLEKNPVTGLERAARTEPRRKTRALTKAEVEKVAELLDGVKTRNRDGNPADKAYSEGWRLMVETGLRVGELRSLTLDSLHFDSTHPHIFIKAEDSKTRRSREVQCSPQAVKIAQAVAARRKQGEFLFPWSKAALTAQLLAFRDKGLIEHTFIHLARHTALVEYAAEAESIKEVQLFSGHTSASGVAPYIKHDLQQVRERVHIKLARRAEARA